MSLTNLNLDSLRSIPAIQKVALLGLFVAGILVAFYYYVVDPKTAEIETVRGQVAQLDTEIQTLTIKVKHLDELVAASEQLEIELAKKRERLPPEEEAVTTPSMTVTARIIPPPGWTCLASFAGTVGERSRHPSRSSSNIGSSRRGTGPSSTGASSGSRQSRFGSPDQ